MNSGDSYIALMWFALLGGDNVTVVFRYRVQLSLECHMYRVRGSGNNVHLFGRVRYKLFQIKILARRAEARDRPRHKMYLRNVLSDVRKV